MSSLDVLFFVCHRVEFMTLQPSKVDGLVDAIRYSNVFIYARNYSVSNKLSCWLRTFKKYTVLSVSYKIQCNVNSAAENVTF